METEEANLSVILAETFSTRQMPSLYQKITVIPEKYYENSDLNHFKWGLYGLIMFGISLFQERLEKVPRHGYFGAS